MLLDSQLLVEKQLRAVAKEEYCPALTGTPAEREGDGPCQFMAELVYVFQMRLSLKIQLVQQLAH